MPISGKERGSTATSFPPPSKSTRHFKLPDWANVRFICPDLWSKLLFLVDGKDTREKISKLKGFRIIEYSADTVIAALRSRADELLDDKRSDPDKLQASLLATAYTMHDKRSNCPPGIFRVKCKDRDYHDIKTVHLSEDYGLCGRITAKLYTDRPEVLVGYPSENGLSESCDDVAGFFVWLGINQWPIEVTEDLPTKKRQRIRNSLPEVFDVSDGNTVRKIKRAEGDDFKATHTTVSGLEQILKTAPCDAVVAWIAYDDRLDPLKPHFKCHNASARHRIG